MRSCVDNPVPAPQAQRHSPRHKALTVTATPHPTPMKVLLLHNRYRQPGGEDRVAAAEASLLRRHGIRVIEPDFENAIAARGRLRQTFELAAQSAWSADSYQRVRKLCELHRPDVAHVHNFWLRMSPSVHAACRDAGVPTVQSLHNYRIVCVNALLLRNGTVCEACVGKVPWRGAVRRCYRGSFWASAAAVGMIVTNRLRGTWTHQAAALVTPSNHSRGKLLAAGLPRDRIFVKPNSVDDPSEPPSAPSTSDSAVFLGRLSPEKGVDVLLRAWARSKLGPYRRLVIAGDGPERAGLEQLAAGLGLRSPAVAFTGLLAPKAAQRFLRNSRVLIAPSIAYETFGLAVIEAFSHGRPVIASRLGALAELVEDEVNGLSASPGDVAALGQALDRILGNARLPDTLGDNARQTFLERYTPQKNFENLVIHFTLVGGRVLGSNVSVGQCLTENQLFDESVEDLAYVAGLSTVEAKGEFVEVALEMHFTHLPLVSRSQPALQQRGNQVNMREFLGCQPRVSRRVGDPVAVAGFLQAPVTPPAVGMDQTAWLHTVAHKTHQTRARCVGDMAQTDPPHSAAFQFHRNHNQGFAHKLSPANVLLLAAQVSLVDLDTSAQPFPSQPNHRLPQLLQHQPGCLIAAQTEFTLQTLSAQPCFLGAGQPHCQKPTPQRHPRVVQDGSRSGRGLASAGATEHRASPRRPTLRGRAVRTNESRGPADADQILATGLLAGKPFSELHQMLWKVLAQLPRSSPPTARVQG